MQINQQYQSQQNQSRSNAEGIKCEDKSEPIKRELGDLRALEKGTAMVQLPSIAESYLDEDRQEHIEEELRVHCCEFCPLVTLVEQTLRDHVHEKHPNRERAEMEFFNCPACENKFWQRRSLEVHLEVDHMMVQSEARTLLEGRFPRAQESNDCGNAVDESNAVPVSESIQMVSPEKNRSRIYIKNVQLLKKPDVIEQENVQQAQQQQQHQQQSTQQQPSQNGKIFIRNVSLLQNLNFAQNVENVFQNPSGLHESKYSFVVPAPSPNSQSPPISVAESMNGGTPQRSKIFIRNVDILRNPMLPITPPTIISTCEMSRTSSSESLYTTPPPPVVSPATSVSSIGTPSSMGFSGLNMVILPTPVCSSNSSTPPTICTPPSMTVANFDPGQQQQPPRKSKIFIKNISVLKQPTIHLKSVDELNLMTIDQVQLQNLLPPTTNAQSLNSAEMNGDSEQQPMQEDNFVNILEEVPSDLDDFQDNGSQYQDMTGCDSACGSVTEQESYQQEFNNDFIIIEPDKSTANITYDDHQEHLRIPTHADEMMDHQQMPLPTSESSEPQQYHHTDEYDVFDIINLDPPARSEPESSEPPSIQSTPPHASQLQPSLQANPGRIYVADNLMEPVMSNLQSSSPTTSHPVDESTISPLNQMEQINISIPAGHTVDMQVQQSPCSSSRPQKPSEKDRERTQRSRGRPKGAKQTGITKLKKLYTNLTPMEAGYKCDIGECGVRFRQPETLAYHKKCHDSSIDGANAEGTRCPECGSQEFRSWNTLHTHLWREHAIDMELYACQQCNFKTPVLGRLNNTHMKIHSDEKNFICAICNKAFKNNKQLRNHRRTHREIQQIQQSAWLHSEFPVKCVKCDFKFANQKFLKAHMESRHGTSEIDGRMKCSLCGMLFKTRYLLQSHMAKHSDEKRFKCSYCDFSCNDHNSMRRHKMRHNSEGHMYRCSYCDYTSIQSTTYRRHLERMHADVALNLLYKCSECTFVSISEVKYQLHRAKHKSSIQTKAVVMQEEAMTASETTESTKQDIELGEERKCESVNSDVVIVEKDSSEAPMDAFSLIPSPTSEHLHDQQFPLIRPAGFANNLSKVDNFYGYGNAVSGGDQQQQQSELQLQQQEGVAQLVPTTDGNVDVPSSTCGVTVGSSASGHQQHGYDSMMNSIASMVPLTFGESALGS